MGHRYAVARGTIPTVRRGTVREGSGLDPYPECHGSPERTLMPHTARAVTYEHLPPRSEPLLWVADVAAWCWARNAHWRARSQPVVAGVCTV